MVTSLGVILIKSVQGTFDKMFITVG